MARRGDRCRATDACCSGATARSERSIALLGQRGRASRHAHRAGRGREDEPRQRGRDRRLATPFPTASCWSSWRRCGRRITCSRRSPRRSHASDAADAIGDRRMLLVLDNLEQVVAAAPALAELASRCPKLAILGTSRERLHLAGRARGRTRSTRARARHRALRRACPRPRCRRRVRRSASRRALRTPGRPAARARARRRPDEALLPVRAARAPRARQRPGGRPERHRTLAATIEWSLDLLNDAERDLFEGLAVFAGPFDVDDVEACSRATSRHSPRSWTRASSPGARASSAVDSLCSQPCGTSSRPRFEARPDASELARRHGDLIAAELERENARPHRSRRRWRRWRRSRGGRTICVRRSASRSTRAKGDLALRLVAAAGRFWYVRGHLVEGSGVARGCARARVLRAERRSARPPACGRATSRMRSRTCRSARAALPRGARDPPLARRPHRECRRAEQPRQPRPARPATTQRRGGRTRASSTLARELDYLIGLASSLHNLSLGYLAEDDAARALPLLEESLVLAERLGLGVRPRQRAHEPRRGPRRARRPRRRARAPGRERADPARAGRDEVAQPDARGAGSARARARRRGDAAAARLGAAEAIRGGDRRGPQPRRRRPRRPHGGAGAARARRRRVRRCVRGGSRADARTRL